MYKITITKTTIEKEIDGHEWKVIGKRLLTEKDLAGTLYETRDETCLRLLDKGVMFDQMGYTPEIERQVIVERQIFEQTVEELDLTAVIKAVNAIAG